MNKNTQYSISIFKIDSIKYNYILLSTENKEYLQYICKIASKDSSQQKKSDCSKTAKSILRESLYIAIYTDNGRSTQTYRDCQNRDKQNLQTNINISKIVSQTRITSDINRNRQNILSQYYCQTRFQTKYIAEINVEQTTKKLQI